MVQGGNPFWYAPGSQDWRLHSASKPCHWTLSLHVSIFWQLADLASLAKLEPESAFAKAKNDVLVQEMDDLLGFAGRAHYSPDRKEAMDALFGTKLPKTFQQIEALMDGTLLLKPA